MIKETLEKMVEKFDIYSHPIYNKVRYGALAVLFALFVLSDVFKQINSAVQNIFGNTSEMYQVTAEVIFVDALMAVVIVAFFDFVLNLLEAFFTEEF